ncbi:hypothetical protein AB0B10_12185 [Micromonospora arborensis]|uniref:hypothetical protein n=1 Tax=Micromonospora arborensis TaxID=2116518 RepID=UPI0033DE670E
MPTHRLGNVTSRGRQQHLRQVDGDRPEAGAVRIVVPPKFGGDPRGPVGQVLGAAVLAAAGGGQSGLHQQRPTHRPLPRRPPQPGRTHAALIMRLTDGLISTRPVNLMITGAGWGWEDAVCGG